MSTILQKNSAKVLHQAERKIAREFGISAGIIVGDDRLRNDYILNDNHNYNRVYLLAVVVASFRLLHLLLHFIYHII